MSGDAVDLELYLHEGIVAALFQNDLVMQLNMEYVSSMQQKTNP